MLQLQVFQRPILSALLPEAAVRQETVAIGIDQLLLEQHVHHIVRGHAALQLCEDILAAGVGEDILCGRKFDKLLGGRLSNQNA